VSDPRNKKERLADLLLQWEEILEQGRDVSAEELCRESPELVEELSRRISALKAVDWVNKTDDTDNYDDGPSTPITPPDEPLAGRYRLDRFIAEGGFGQVWQGFDLELERAVAVKMPKASRLASPEQVEKFVAEARRVAQLKHPGIVPVFDVVRDGGSCLIVSEFVEGGSLAEKIGTLDAREAVRLIAEIAETLHYAHQQGFIHRDIKPPNILIDHHRRALLADFGIALNTQDAGDSPSHGTLAYMSPEQVEGISADHRSDIFGLGVVLVELLTGNRPFDDDNPARLRERILAGEMSLSGVPSGLEATCKKCLARNPDDRYADAASLASDLRVWLQHRPIKKLWAAVPVVLLLLVGGVVLFDDFFGEEPTNTILIIDATDKTQPKLQTGPASKTLRGPLPKAAEVVHRQACELFNAGKVTEALPLLDRAAQLDPTNPEVFKNRGIAYLNLGKFDNAVTDLETALTLDVDHPDKYRKVLGQTYAASATKHSESRSWEAAIADMDRAIENDPANADYFHRRASMYFNQQQFEKAITDWTEAIRLAPSIAMYYEHRGYALKASGRDDEAAKNFGKASELGAK
jgi:tetratricopeptide (TPR) repeat protein